MSNVPQTPSTASPRTQSTDPTTRALSHEDITDLYSRVKRRSALGTITNTVHSTPRRARPPDEQPTEGELSAQTINTEHEPGAFATPRYTHRIPRRNAASLMSSGHTATVRRPLGSLNEHPRHHESTTAARPINVGANRTPFQSPFAMRPNESIHIDSQFSQPRAATNSNQHDIVSRLQIDSTPESIPTLEPPSPLTQQARRDSLNEISTYGVNRKTSKDETDHGAQQSTASRSKRGRGQFKKPADLTFPIPEEFLRRSSRRSSIPSTVVKAEDQVAAEADTDASVTQSAPPAKRRKSASNKQSAVRRKTKVSTAVKSERPARSTAVAESDHNSDDDASNKYTPLRSTVPTTSRKSARARRVAESLSSLATPVRPVSPVSDSAQVKCFFTLPNENLLFLSPIVLSPSVESTQAFTGPFTQSFITSLQQDGSGVINEYLRVEPLTLFNRVLIILKRDKVKQRAVARAVGLAPSTISPMLKGNYKHTKVGHLNKLRSWCIHRDVAFMTSVVQRAQIIGLDENGLTGMSRVDMDVFSGYLLFTLDLEQRSTIDSKFTAWLKATQSAMEKIVHASLERVLTQQYRNAVRLNMVPNARSKSLVNVSRDLESGHEEDEDALVDLPQQGNRDNEDKSEENSSSSSSDDDSNTSSSEALSPTSSDSEPARLSREKRHVSRSRAEQRRDTKRLRAETTTSPSVSSSSNRPSLNITVDSIELNPDEDEAHLSSSSVIGRRKPAQSTFVHASSSTSNLSNIGARLLSPREITSPLRRLSRAPPAPPSSPFGGPCYSPRSQSSVFKALCVTPQSEQTGRLSFSADFNNASRNTSLLQQFATEAANASANSSFSLPASLNSSITSTSPSSLSNASFSRAENTESVARLLDWGGDNPLSRPNTPSLPVVSSNSTSESVETNDSVFRTPTLPARKTHRRNLSSPSVPAFTSQTLTSFLSVPEYGNPSLPPMPRNNRRSS